MQSLDPSCLVESSRALYLPPLAGYLIALYAEGFQASMADNRGPALWRDCWAGSFGMVRIWGADVGRWRWRLVAEPCPPNRRQPAKATLMLH